MDNKTTKMSEKHKTIFLIASVSLMAVSAAMYISYDVYKFGSAKRQYVIDRDTYIEKTISADRSMLPVLNRYFNCETGKIVAIEGCFDYAAKTNDEKMKMAEVARQLSLITEKRDKSMGWFLNF